MNLSYIIDETILDAKNQSSIILDSSKSIEHFDKHFELSEPKEDSVKLTEDLWKDTGFEEWSKTQTKLFGGNKFLIDKLKNPTSNKKNILEFQDKIKNLPDLDNELDDIASFEKDVLWLINLGELKKSWPINMMFPLTFPLKYLNNVPLLVEFFHLYKCYLAPIITVISPLTTIIGPYIYINRTLKLNLKFKDYIGFLMTAFKGSLRSSGNIQSDSMKYLTIFMYIFFYIYNIVQTFESASMFQKIRYDLKKKMENVNKFVATFYKIKSVRNEEVENEMVISILPGLSGFYQIAQDPLLKNKLKNILKYLYDIDIMNVGRKLIKEKVCCFVKFSNKSTKMIDMSHVQFGKTGIKNNMTLAKNIIITGPNAAGKTTYIKSIFTNTILAQSLGIACAKSARIKIVHVIGSFMRISDDLGSKSLFEAEIQRCNQLIKYAEEISAKKQNALFFFDEPMHSTPPIEGTATTIAVSEYLSKLPGIRLLLTTHYFEVTELEKLYKSDFKNLSMEAIPLPENKFKFPYLIKQKPSFQCIALELLETNDFPEIIISRAIEIKNKLCKNKLNEFSLIL
jgi:hypothetical protein